MTPRTTIGWKLALALALSGCAGTTEAPPPPPGELHTQGEGVALDDGRVEIEGQLLAHDGTPLRRAEVIVRRAGFMKTTTEALDDAGHFRVSIPAGVYDLSIAAVDHSVISRRVVATDDLRVEGRMGTYARTDPGPTLALHGEYLDAEGKVIAPGPISAPRVAGTVYRLELPDKPKGAVRLRYQLVAPTGRTCNGPLADDYQSDGGGDFWSIVDVADEDALELDLRALPPAGTRPQLQWKGESATAAAMIDFEDRWTEARGEILDRIPRTDGKILGLTDALRTELVELAAEARKEADASPDPALQGLLRATQMGVFSLFLATAADAPALEAEVGWVVDHVSPTDPHLALLINFDNVMFAARRDADDAFLARTDAWLERQAREHPEPSVAISALSTLVHVADRRGDDARAEQLYALAMDDRFDGTFQRTFLEQQYDPNRVLKRGKAFPAFDFVGLRDTDPRVTSVDRAGTMYLVEFWATWCGPCVADMPKLHATYAAINGAEPGKGKGQTKGKTKRESSGDAGMRRLQPAERPRIEFVFVSLDAVPAEVEAFRKEHWSMPWIHAFVGQSGQQELMKRFGFSGVPTAVLVDEAGTIVEVGGSLRGDELQPTLERALAERSGTASPP